jgi:putative lipoprotein (rSAM/lipoprotein system)
MKNFFVKLTKMLCVAVLGVLGFSACSDDPEGHWVAYGSPNAKYKYMGTVTDEQGNPIEGINVVMSGDYVSSTPLASLTLKTDKDGKFSTVTMSSVNTRIKTIEFVDVDGEANGGEFESQTISPKDMTMTQVAEGDGSWYKGEFELSATIKLKSNEKSNQ